MDIRIESNIGLDLINIDCIQRLLRDLRATYPESALLMIHCNQEYEDGFRTKISLTLFDKDNTERLYGVDRNPHGLLSNLLNGLIERKKKQLAPAFIPIRTYINPDLGTAI